jgi:acyl-CoA synthetase (AMP-forming)/AMP-acid ligase II
VATDTEQNFAAWLVNRLGPQSKLIDAASGLAIEAQDVPGAIAGFATVFRDTGLQEGEIILTAGSLSPLSCLAYLGAMWAGLVVAPVEERSLATMGENLIKTTGAKGIWTEQKLSFDWLRQSPVTCLHGDLTAGKPSRAGAAARRNEDVAALMGTSGSTGVPRFVRVTHGNLRSNTEAISRSQSLREDERAMLVLPLSYCFGTSVLHTHLAQGGGVVFDRRFMFPDKVLQAIQQHHCTTFAGVPTAYNVLLQRSRVRSMEFPTLRRMLQAGGALARPAMDEIRQAVPNAQFYAMYGQTEATSRISCLDPARLHDKAGSVGRPLDNLTVRIMDEQGHEVKTGQTGEIWVKGPSICAGYLNDDAETARVFQNGWLRTRDLGALDEDGFLWVQGRLGSFVKMRGVRVSFSEAEAKVASIQGVLECAAVAATHPEAGEALALMIVLKQGTQLAPDEIRRQLPAHWAVDSVRFVADLPKTANGKLSRSVLAEQFKEAHGSR